MHLYVKYTRTAVSCVLAMRVLYVSCMCVCVCVIMMYVHQCVVNVDYNVGGGN